MGSPWRFTHTEALFAASRLSSFPISDENRDGDRAFPNPLESQLRIRVPARIALQGGGTRGRRSDVAPALRKKRATPGLAWQPTAPGPGASSHLNRPVRAAHTPPTLRHTKEGVLAEPFNNTKKPGRGQRILPSAAFFLRYAVIFSLFDGMELPGAVGQSKLAVFLLLNVFPGFMSNFRQRRGNASQIHTFVEYRALSRCHARSTSS